MEQHQSMAPQTPQPETPPVGQYPPQRGPYREAPYRYDPRSKSPLLAFLLSAMPGLGQVYVGYYQRGFTHILVVGGLIALLASEAIPDLIPLLGIFLAFFWMYNCIDAARRASLYNQALAGATPIQPPDDIVSSGAGGSMLGGVVLIAGGFLLLLRTQFDVSLAWLKDWWPVIPMLFGIYLVLKSIAARSTND